MISEKIKAKAKDISSNSVTTPQNNNEWHSFDDVMNAWEAGKKHYNQKLMKELERNLKLAQNISEEFIKLAESDLKVKCKSIHLKDDLYDFTAIFIIPERAFLSVDTFSKLSDLSAKCTNQNPAEDFTISFLFMPYSRTINREALIADGYNYVFNNG